MRSLLLINSEFVYAAAVNAYTNTQYIHTHTFNLFLQCIRVSTANLIVKVQFRMHFLVVKEILYRHQILFHMKLYIYQNVSLSNFKSINFNCFLYVLLILFIYELILFSKYILSNIFLLIPYSCFSTFMHISVVFKAKKSLL